MSTSKFEYDKWFARYGLNPNDTKREKDYWWEKERDFWVEGRFGLVGPHYYALTQGKVKDARGYTKRPVWRDVDDMIYGGYMEARRTSHDVFVTKRREIGLSFIFGGIIPMWVAMTNPGSTSLITSADKKRLEALFKDKTRVVYDEFDAYARPGVVSTRQEGYLHMGKREPKTGTITGLNSQIITKETVDVPTAFEAYRAMHVFIDECMLHPKADKVYKSAQASTKSGFLKIAPIVIGGSAGEATSVGQKLARTLWDGAKQLKIITMFIPGYLGIMEAPEIGEDGLETGRILNFCPNGHSDEQGAKEWILRTREMLDQLEDKSFLNTFIKQYPLEIQEVFSTVGIGAFPKPILDKIENQERIILSTRPQLEKIQLYEGPDGKIEKMLDSKSKIVILEEPIPGHTYIGGIDPIPFNSTNMGDGSEQAIAIKDLDTNRYVAVYSERDSEPDTIVRNMILMQRWYNEAIAMIEINRGGVVKKAYKDAGWGKLLAKRPTFLGKGFVKDEEAIGYYKNDATSERGNTYLINYLTKHTEQIMFMQIIEQLKVYLVDNTDIVDAMVAAEILHMNIIEKAKKMMPASEVRVRKIPVLVFQNGKYIRVWQEVRV